VSPCIRNISTFITEHGRRKQVPNNKTQTLTDLSFPFLFGETAHTETSEQCQLQAGCRLRAVRQVQRLVAVDRHL